MEIAISGSEQNTVTVSDSTFGREYNEALVHQVVTAYLAAGRQGSKAQKTRSDVRGGGKKPWRQKGTGRARAGTARSPIWVGGGAAFAATPQDHSQKVNKKMYRAALRSIWSELVRQKRLMVVEAMEVENPKTKPFCAKLKGMGLESALIVSSDVGQNLYLAARNIPNVEVCDVVAVDPVSLIAHSKVVVTLPALKKVEEMLL